MGWKELWQKMRLGQKETKPVVSVMVEVEEDKAGIPTKLSENLTDEVKDGLKEWWNRLQSQCSDLEVGDNRHDLPGRMLSAAAGGYWDEVIGYIVYELGKGRVEGDLSVDAVGLLLPMGLDWGRIRQAGHYLESDDDLMRVRKLMDDYSGGRS